ncbi:MAG TPA: DUF6600 domain-containing protein, partial [Prosthecobacter sp.]|nr:DUF6600 domain-containing protein [Prosthecobacter sp.]
MKTRFPLLLLAALALTGCDSKSPPQVENTSTVNDDTRRQLEDARLAAEQQAADIEARSARLEQELADLRQSIRDKENAEMQARLAAIEEENRRLQAEAEAARRRSDELRDQLAATPVSGPVSQPWIDPSADYSPFYEELTPYGNWLDVEGYGYAWRPNLASNANWRPYVDGHWVWSDHGWAWNTPEPFGWATYHYGRWVRIARHGWVWIPGREWAPAWVSWRFGDSCVGWAPLPPPRRHHALTIGYDADVYFDLSPASYVFIEPSHFARPSYVNITLSFTNVTRLFHTTVNVTNIVQVNNIFVHRGGPDRDWVERRCGTRVPRAAVQVVNNVDRSRWHQMARPDRRGDSVQFVAAPLPPAPSGRAFRPPPKIAERITRPAVVDSWSDVPADRRGELREIVTRQSRDRRPGGSVTTTPTSPSDPSRDGDRGRGRGDRDRDGDRPPTMPPAPTRPGTPV